MRLRVINLSTTPAFGHPSLLLFVKEGSLNHIFRSRKIENIKAVVKALRQFENIFCRDHAQVNQDEASDIADDDIGQCQRGLAFACQVDGFHYIG